MRDHDERLAAVFEELRRSDPATRAERLRALDRRDPDLAKAARSLLSAHEQVPTFLEGDLPDVFPDEDAPPRRIEGRRLGRYELGAVIGIGGSSVVYRARDTRSGEDVALKLLRAVSLGGPSLERFRAVWALLDQLRHPAISAVIEADVGWLDAEPVPYLAIELVRGARLLTDHAAAHDLSRDERLVLFLDACDAVGHAHGKGIIHRDLKPGNILVDTGGQVKVIDFGVARMVEDPGGGPSRTTSGVILGTPRYMSPERFLGDVDVRVDVYALGVLLYELLTGAHPLGLESEPLPVVARLVGERTPRAPSSLDPALAGDLETIMLGALAREPSLRYESASALSADIRRFLGGTPIAARAPGIIKSLRLKVRRRRNLIVASSAVLVLLAALTTLSTVLWLRSEDARAAEVRERRLHDEARRELRELGRLLARERPAGIDPLPLAPELIVRTRESVAAAPNLEQRRQRLGHAIERLRRLESLAGDDDELKLSVARTYVELGNLVGAHWRSPADHVRESEPALRRAVEIYTRVMSPDDLGARRGLVEALSQHAQCLRKLEDAPGAATASQRACDIAAALVREEGSLADIELFVEACWARSDAAILRRDLDAGLDPCRRALALLGSTDMTGSRRLRILEMIAWSHYRAGRWLEWFERIGPALEQYRQATAALDHVTRARADYRKAHRDLLHMAVHEVTMLERRTGSAAAAARLSRVLEAAQAAIELGAHQAGLAQHFAAAALELVRLRAASGIPGAPPCLRKAAAYVREARKLAPGSEVLRALEDDLSEVLEGERGRISGIR